MNELEMLRSMAIDAQEEAAELAELATMIRWVEFKTHLQRNAWLASVRAQVLNDAYQAALKAASDDPFEKWPDTGVVCPRCGHKTMPRDDPRPPEEPLHWHAFDCECGEHIEVRVHFAEHWWLPGPGESY